MRNLSVYMEPRLFNNLSEGVSECKGDVNVFEFMVSGDNYACCEPILAQKFYLKMERKK